LIDCHEYLYHQLGLCSDEIALYFDFVFNDFDCITEVASFFVRVTNNSQYDALLRNFDLNWYLNNDILRPTNNRRPHRYMRGNLFSVREFDTEHVYIGSSLDHFADMPVRNTGDVVNYRAALDARDFPCDFNSVADRYAHRDDFPYGVALQIPREDVRIIAEIEVIVNTDLEEGCINFVWTDNHGESYVNRNFIRCRRSDDAPEDYTYNFIDYLSPEDPAGACLFDKCNIPEVCDDGIDNDLDGLIDCEDDDCGASDAIEVSISLDQHASCVDSEGGQITIHSNAYDLSVYNICIDDACADDKGSINQLPAGDHDLIISNSEDCPVPYTVATEICGNDIDDDGDGYVDCEDLDCFSAKSDNCLAFDEEINTCILMNLELFNGLNLESIEDSGLFCETLMQNPFAREIEEKDNCITIISSSASSEFASGQLIAIPDNEIGDDRLYPNPNARLKGGDLASNDYSREEALVLLSQMNQFLLQEHVTPQFLLARMRILFNTLTVRNPFTYRKVADRFIERFELFDGQDLVDNELNELLTETNAFKNDVKDLGKQVSCSLSPLHPIDETQTYNLPDNPLKNDAFRFVYTAAEGYVFRGPFVLIHDTDNIEYNLISFDGDVSDGKWDACFSIRSTDNFGLDTDDFLEFQNYETDKLDLGFNVDFGIGTGIASWWLLQHVYGFEPFRNVMLFEVCIQGEINDCNCG